MNLRKYSNFINVDSLITLDHFTYLIINLAPSKHFSSDAKEGTEENLLIIFIIKTMK